MHIIWLSFLGSILLVQDKSTKTISYSSYDKQMLEKPRPDFTTNLCDSRKFPTLSDPSSKHTLSRRSLAIGGNLRQSENCGEPWLRVQSSRVKVTIVSAWKVDNEQVNDKTSFL